MDRPDHNNVKYFTGVEVEHSPAYQLPTLFVVGLPDSVDELLRLAATSSAQHIYLGANQSFSIEPADQRQWDTVVTELLKRFSGWVSLDFDVKHIEYVLECGWCEFNRFIPMISVKVPYIQQLNYNATLKIDDVDFEKTNPGVWCHRLHKLMDPSTFTDWTKYRDDKTNESTTTD